MDAGSVGAASSMPLMTQNMMGGNQGGAGIQGAEGQMPGAQQVDSGSASQGTTESQSVGSTGSIGSSSSASSTQVSEFKNPMEEEIGDLMQEWIIETLIRLFQDILDMGASEQGTNGDDDASFGVNPTDKFLTQLSNLSQQGQVKTQMQQFSANQNELQAYQSSQLDNLTQGAGSLLNIST